MNDHNSGDQVVISNIWGPGEPWEEPRDVTPPTASLGMDDKIRRIGHSDLGILRTLPAVAEVEERGCNPPTSPPAGVSPTGSSTTEEPTTERCPHCDGAGYHQAPVRFGHPDFGTLLPCKCKLAEQAERAERRQAARLRHLMGIAGRFADATFDTFALDRDYPKPVEWFDLGASTGAQRWYAPDLQRRSIAAAISAARDYAAAPRGGLLFQGPYGSGKSHLAYAVARELAQRGHSIAADSLPALLQFIRDGFADNTAGQRLSDLKTVDLLILDDVGTENATDWTMEQVFNVINHRYVFDLWTICTSNVPVFFLPGRIGSRLAEYTQVVPVIAYDHRLLKQRRIG